MNYKVHDGYLFCFEELEKVLLIAPEVSGRSGQERLRLQNIGPESVLIFGSLP